MTNPLRNLAGAFRLLLPASCQREEYDAGQDNRHSRKYSQPGGSSQFRRIAQYDRHERADGVDEPLHDRQAERDAQIIYPLAEQDRSDTPGEAEERHQRCAVRVCAVECSQPGYGQPCHEPRHDQQRGKTPYEPVVLPGPAPVEFERDGENARATAGQQDQ